MSACDARALWRGDARPFLTHCFDDIFLFGAATVFIFMFGSYRAWTLLHIPPMEEFPYSTMHSVKVMVLGWLGMFPLIVFAAKYANGAHDDFEWIAKPLASSAWLYSLWLFNMEVSRNLTECWILKTFWATSAIAGTFSLPTVVIASETNGYGLSFYAYLLHYVLYLVIVVLAFRFPHQSKDVAPELGTLQDAQSKMEGAEGKDRNQEHLGFLTEVWRDRFWKVLSMFEPEKLLLSLSFLCMIASVASSGFAFVILGRLFNNFYYPYSPGSARGHLREYCVILVAIYLICSILDAAYATIIHNAEERMASRTRRKVFHNLLRQEVEFFDGKKPEELVESIQNDVALLQKTLGDHMIHGLHCILTVLMCIFIMFMISWKITLVVLSLVPICMLVGKIQKFYARRLGKERAEAMATSMELVEETLSSLRIVRSLAAESRQLEKFKEMAADIYDLSLQTGLVDATSKSSATLMIQLAVVLSLYVSGLAVLSRQVEVGYLVTYAGVTILAISSIAQLSPLLRQITKALRASERVFHLLDRSPKFGGSGGSTMEKVDGRIEMREVDLFPDAPSSDKLLSSVSISAGSIAAIVGGRGAGKTRLMESMQRMQEPAGGSILLDGSDVKALDPDWLREHVVAVQTEPVLFAMSIAQNISYAVETASQAQVEAAARLACAHEFIQLIPDSYQAHVGDTGVRLTAMQKLQVAIARAWLTTANVILLDDVFSRMDAETARRILSNLRGRRGDRTVIIFSSSSSLLEGTCDSFSYLEGGRLLGTGSHGELAAVFPSYAQLADRHGSSQDASHAEEAEEGVWRRRLQLADELEDSIFQLGLPQGKVMALVEMANEMKEALVLESQTLG